MLERLMERSKTSGREDDNRESIVKRFRGFIVSLDPRFDSLPLSLCLRLFRFFPTVVPVVLTPQGRSSRLRCRWWTTTASEARSSR